MDLFSSLLSFQFHPFLIPDKFSKNQKNIFSIFAQIKKALVLRGLISNTGGAYRATIRTPVMGKSQGVFA